MYADSLADFVQTNTTGIHYIDSVDYIEEGHTIFTNSLTSISICAKKTLYEKVESILSDGREYYTKFSKKIYQANSFTITTRYLLEIYLIQPKSCKTNEHFYVPSNSAAGNIITIVGESGEKYLFRKVRDFVWQRIN